MRLRRLEPILRRALRGPGALPPGSRLLVALSGGPDSVGLLCALHRIAPEFGLSLHAAHLHHGLRGADADADLAFVRDLCARLGIPLASARWKARARMERRGLAGENGLRTLRREFLLGVARRAGARAIATAHTADDQLETVLMRLLRGAGLPGLGGMGARRGPWLKPLLEATRADVEADLVAIGQPWREDLSNRDPAFTRNRIRHEAIPALIRAFAPDADAARARPALARRVAAAAREARDAERALRLQATRDPSRPWRIQRGVIAVDSARMRSYPVAARRAIVRAAWSRLLPGGPGLTRHHLSGLIRLVAGARTGAVVGLPGGVTATRERDIVRLARAAGSRSAGARLAERQGVLEETAAHPRAQGPPAGPRRRRRESQGDRSPTLRSRPDPGRHPHGPPGSRGVS
jgi:tRNA(Ile)-lysidine synthase